MGRYYRVNEPLILDFCMRTEIENKDWNQIPLKEPLKGNMELQIIRMHSTWKNLVIKNRKGKSKTTLRNKGRVSKKPFNPKIRLGKKKCKYLYSQDTVKEELKAINYFLPVKEGIFNTWKAWVESITYYPRALVEFVVKKGARSKWGLTSKKLRLFKG